MGHITQGKVGEGKELSQIWICDGAKTTGKRSTEKASTDSIHIGEHWIFYNGKC